ncbi:MAG: biotin--[acetyl-CoA-carboxylase] ligase [Candidatus Hydrogenedentes bacterium]|nr:biotin--[acetyl-CoA-carboxylase] ligase [Candidatus Hydrogenedentota bacterium]
MSEPAPAIISFDVPLSTRVVGGQFYVFGEVESTNDLALQLGSDGAVVVAERQTAGRGRHGRVWHSPRGMGLWFSVALEGHLRGLPFAAALAVRDALQPRCPVVIKWPNDLLIHGRKVCGILVEHRGERNALGIGLNVHQRLEDFPEELRAKATSLELATGSRFDRAALLRDILTRLDERVLALRGNGYEAIRREWAHTCDLKGRDVRYGGIAGTVKDIDEHGALIVVTVQGEHRLISGEIEILTQGV